MFIYKVTFTLSLLSSVQLKLPIIRRWQFMPMGVGQLLQTVFNCSLAIVRFMMNKSMDQKPEVSIVIRLYFVKKGINKMS